MGKHTFGSLISRDVFGAFLALDIPNRIALLRRLLDAIGKWKSSTGQDLEDLKRRIRERQAWLIEGYKTLSTQIAEPFIIDADQYDPIADEAFMLLEMERAMYAQLALTISACTENTLVEICENIGAVYQDHNGKTDLRVMSSNLAKGLRKPVSSLATVKGWKSYDRARLLANSFKHSNGQRNGDPIQYENEDWAGIIEGIEVYLLNLAARLG